MEQPVACCVPRIQRVSIAIAFLCGLGLACSDSGTGATKTTDDFFFAAKHGTLSDVVRLLAQGDDLNETDSLGWTPLHYAINRTQFPKLAEDGVVELMVQSGADVSKPANSGETPIHVAAWAGSIDSATLLLEAGANVDVVDYRERTPVIAAITRNRIEMVEFLLDRGAELHAVTRTGYTLLHVSVMSNRLEISRELLIRGADVNASPGPGGSPLHFVAESGFERLADLLVESGGDVNMANYAGDTPLHLAVRHDTAFVNQLLRAGADPTIRNRAGLTPHDVADALGNEPVLVLLEASQRSPETS